MFKNATTISVMTSLVSSVAFAQAKQEVKEVEKALEELRIAMVDGNKAALENIAHDSLSYGHSGGHVENKVEFMEKIVSGKSDFVSIAISNQTIKMMGNTAVVRHDFNAETNNNGTPGTVSLHILTIWQNQKGKWKLLARQAVKLAH